MLISATITSGRSLIAASTNSLPSTAIPTSSNSGLKQAPHTFGQDPVVVGQQYPWLLHDTFLNAGTRTVTVVPCPGFESTENSPRTRRTRSPMLESPSPSRAHLRRGEADAPILDGQDEFRARPHERHLASLGPGMLDDISQGFLGNAVDTESHVLRQRADEIVRAIIDRDRLPSRNAGTLGAQGVDQPQVVEDRGVEVA